MSIQYICQKIYKQEFINVVHAGIQQQIARTENDVMPERPKLQIQLNIKGQKGRETKW